MTAAGGLIVFPGREAMAARLADLVWAHLAVGDGELAASGGGTPRPLYEELARRAARSGRGLRVTLVDERWVPPDHPRSNEAFVRSAFAAAPGVAVSGLYETDAASAAAAAPAVARRLDARSSPFDVVVLGMGVDGHTASWVPHAEGLDDALTGDRPLCAVRAKRSEVTGAEVDRMTLTLSAICSARLIILMLTGEDKRAPFDRASAGGPMSDMPVRAVLEARPDLWACWAR